MVEFALVAPILLIIIFVCAELFRYILILQKVERTSYMLANIVTQYTPDTTANVITEINKKSLNDDVFPQMARVMDSFFDPAEIRAAISSVSNVSAVAGTPDMRVNWQIASSGNSGTFSSPETISIVNAVSVDNIDSTPSGTSATFTPAINLTLQTIMPTENMIVVEIFYHYQPMFLGELGSFGTKVLAEQVMISRSYARPRQGDLTVLPATTP